MKNCITISALLMGIALAVKLSEAQGGRGDWGGSDVRGGSEVCGGSGNRVSGGGVGGAEPSAEMKKVLDMLNELRRKLARGQIPGQPASGPMPNLRWNSTLAAKAQAWAKKCKFKDDPKLKSIGQNIAVYGSLEDNVIYWYDQYKNYNYCTNQCKGGRRFRHYTQMVWAETTDLGCGVNWCRHVKSNLLSLVCNYFPAGNVEGKKPYCVSQFSPSTKFIRQSCCEGKNNR